MWLDRLSSNSTPSGSPPPPTNRSFPTTTRRPSNLGPSTSAQRPGFNPRSSSLSLASNESTTSLLASSRRPNGSGLRQSTTVPDTADPLEVLEKLLGSEGKGSTSSSKAPGINGANNASEESDFELDFEGLSLRELALGQEDERESVYATQSIEECSFCRIYLPRNITDVSTS